MVRPLISILQHLLCCLSRNHREPMVALLGARRSFVKGPFCEGTRAGAQISERVEDGLSEQPFDAPPCAFLDSDPLVIQQSQLNTSLNRTKQLKQSRSNCLTEVIPVVLPARGSPIMDQARKVAWMITWVMFPWKRGQSYVKRHRQGKTLHPWILIQKSKQGTGETILTLCTRMTT